MSEKRRMGIVLHGHWLGYGLDHGAFMWLPYVMQRQVVRLGNNISCSLLGHGAVVQDERDGPAECCECCRSVDPVGDDVIRMWQIEWPASGSIGEAGE